MNGALYIVATPIGNREDITLRALKTLLTVPVIAAEDTRKTGLLVKHYHDSYAQNLGVSRQDHQKFISFYDEVELQKTSEIIEILQSGTDVALVSDAGTPLINDPGYNLVRECYRQNIMVSPIPGPSSVIAALSVAGMPTDKLLFIGYLPKKEGKRTKELEHIKDLSIKSSIVLLETPHRIVQTLSEIEDILGNVDIAICSELTKMHERVTRGKISDIRKEEFNTKGEFVIVLGSV